MTDKMSNTTRTTSTHRFWRRSKSPRPWWPWGLLPAAGLLATFLIGAIIMAPRLEADVLENVQHRLDVSPFESTVRASGQGVAIQAAAPEADRNHIDALARSTRCATWVGELTCPTTLTLDLTAPPVVEAPAVSLTTPVAESPGSVGVIDEPVAATSTVNPVDDCNEEFASIFESNTIVFRTGSADIDISSSALLDQIAEVSAKCPGELRIEGHTDSRGSDDMNLALSSARAAAVRNALGQRGVDADRLHAQGFGETRPIADNDTAAGRAQNRRIAIVIQQ